ncbi:MAG TPA: 2-dehydro-3-deoxy-D-gluconate 5-dehydrogenase KduD [Micromonosporaceae bacterium]|nr:2-dehydro-3-deoxy-D-gluconate 5-dehydrogenase KduD [Micromonosporaceae bacterium]
MSEARGLFDLTGKVAVVTGCRRGIGLAIARALAHAGADIVGVSAALEESGSVVARQVEECGRTFRGYRLDLADRAAVRTLTGRMEAEVGTIDVLVNNAGTIRRAPAVDYTDADWDHVLEVDLTAHFNLARDIGRGMLARGQGKIIFTASLLSFQGGINVAAYAAAKSGIAGITRALANEWASRGVNVNAIAPGYIATDNTRPLRDDPDRNAGILARIPAGRWGSPDDLAGAAVFLAAAASDYVHGTVLPVDGGWLSR